jgi:hypothetical protein
MFRTVISTAAAGAALAVLSAIAPATVNAQSLNLNFPACTGGFGLVGSVGNQTLTCLTGGGGPAAFSCGLSGAPSGSVTPGTAVTLQMNCSGGTAPYSYSWSQGSTGASLSVNPTVTTAYSVTARDSAGGSSTQSATVSVACGGGGGGGGGGGNIANCSAQGYSVLGGAAINVTWGQPLSANSGAFGNSQVWLFQMTVPAGVAQTAGIGYFNVVENGGSPTTRQMFVSTTPCDFTDPNNVASQGVTATVYYNTAAFPTPTYANLTPGTTYYITVRNFDYASNSGTCPNNNCTAIMNAQPQH